MNCEASMKRRTYGFASQNPGQLARVLQLNCYETEVDNDGVVYAALTIGELGVVMKMRSLVSYLMLDRCRGR